jgi:hypothetical protein
MYLTQNVLSTANKYNTQLLYIDENLFGFIKSKQCCTYCYLKNYDQSEDSLLYLNNNSEHLNKA